MTLMTLTKKIDGDSSGIVMEKNLRTGPAPSRSAASMIVSGMPWSPARKMTMLVPSPAQMPTTAIAINAVFGSVSQLRPSMPTAPRAAFRTP